ncbi:hypothetical protein CXF72_06285 [Psychromonas sp. MB-3u-54]|uniref:acyltransferase n=1 Tax=Psychromonas sp. MB-3u-54 TaxID=2058319 RepID=UPI000C31D8DC|nr:acyltransferase [Psychromonas sp. MB-3u-54]PKH03414.1 hypothetical protein CXF72_06285 [Psychromonas sp. MB-3u-54]
MIKKTYTDYLFKELPLWFICTITSFLPDHPFFCKIRGWLAKPFFTKCGKNFQFGSRVRFIRPSQITIGNNVYLAEGCWADGTAGITLEDEVLFGPYCIVVSTLHGRDETGSYRFARGKQQLIHIGRGTWLCAHTVVSAGSTIGSGCVIGANAVVTGSIENNKIVRTAHTNISSAN